MDREDQVVTVFTGGATGPVKERRMTIKEQRRELARRDAEPAQQTEGEE